MCLIVFAWQVVPGAPLVAAANRDEYYDRTAIAAHWWGDYPEIYAGRDLQGGGTWLGVTRSGRFAAVTNVRAPTEKRLDATSRGKLAVDFLSSDTTSKDFVVQLSTTAADYNGFNLLISDGTDLVWYSNMAADEARNGQSLPPGIYGLSNAALDAPWPKVIRTKAQFASLLCQGAPEDAYFEMLTDTTRASDCRLPKTGVPVEWERILSAVMIESPEYGTRSSTVVKLFADRSVTLQEHVIR